jgi:putative ABC transport system permease protein
MRRRFRGLFGLDPKPDVADELSFHLDMRVRELIARGETPERARELALRRFGNYQQSQRECIAIDERVGRKMIRSNWIKELKQDLGYALRMFRRAPGFALVAIVTLALGIGANSAIFSVVHAVLLESLPFEHADRLYRIRTVYPDGTQYSVSAPDFASIRQSVREFDGVEAYSSAPLTMASGAEPREVQSVGVTDGLFDLLGLKVGVGRKFELGEHQPGRNGVVILDDGFWKRQFGGDANVVGRNVTLAGRPATIIGVLAKGARLPIDAEVYTPIEYDDTFSATNTNARRGEFLGVIGRGRIGKSREALNADVQRIGGTLAATFAPTNAGLGFSATPVRELLLGDVETPLLVLLGAVGFVLLVACANVANLLLARASARQQEMAVRAALGARRSRLIRQLISESVLLGLIGGAVGLALAYAGTRALIAAQPADIPRLSEVSVNGTVMLFTLAISLGTGLVFGALPAFMTTGRVLTQALIGGGRSGGATKRGHQIRSGLVIAEMALAVVLLTGAGLLIRSFVALTDVPSGFNADRAMSFRLSLQGPAYAQPQDVGIRVAALEERLRALPGVSSVAMATALPLSRGSLVDFAVEGAPPPPANVNAEISMVSVTPDYFTAVGVPLKSGRLIAPTDTAESPIVVVANEAAVKLWFPDRDPIGAYVLAGGGRRRQIVGIVKDVRQRDPRQPASPQMFAPYAQRISRNIRVIVRSNGNPMDLAPSVHAAVRAVDPDVAVAAMSPLKQVIDDSVARPRFYTSLLALFAVVALLLAATGIFGVMSYAVAQRAKEISIRMALGAHVGGVLRMIVGRAMLLALGGVVVGTIASMILGKAIQTQLFGVSLFDPLTLVAVSVVLGLSAALASLLPAWRAAAIDPGGVLRQ